MSPGTPGSQLHCFGSSGCSVMIFCSGFQFLLFSLITSLILKILTCVNSALNKTWHPPELWQVVCFESPAMSKVVLKNNLPCRGSFYEPLSEVDLEGRVQGWGGWSNALKVYIKITK